jgi:hypothetical protein
MTCPKQVHERPLTVNAYGNHGVLAPPATEPVTTCFTTSTEGK